MFPLEAKEVARLIFQSGISKTGPVEGTKAAGNPMYQIGTSKEPPEGAGLISQNAIPKPGRGGRRKPVLAFTQEGVAMLSSVLRRPRAVRVNIEIMRVFVRLRSLLAAHADLARRLDELEGRYDQQCRAVFDAIRALTAPPGPPPRAIGFHVRDRSSAYRATRKSRSATRPGA